MLSRGVVASFDELEFVNALALTDGKNGGISFPSEEGRKFLVLWGILDLCKAVFLSIILLRLAFRCHSVAQQGFRNLGGGRFSTRSLRARGFGLLVH